MKRKRVDLFVNICIPVLTVLAYIIIGLKLPQWGLVVNLAAQPFWFYAAWKAYKEANQVGILITSTIISLALIFGILNYWVF
ncbi:MAG: hypothetical protein PHV78_02005 [Patescibacteria group bacterium]|nr:hypothetical protein [Patescibacteria group bacterium]MDD5121077.1 hypothetical protein [Patescibacteria group bacterium]MDD5221561.1 hypothetical protein [Patescibacteria group bacterium]MDD5396004.1 hypothetical protein [Patescibacteria group bacterium]